MAKKIKQPFRKKDAIQAAINYGIDVSVLKDNLKRSPAERIKRHQIALNTAEKLRKATMNRPRDKQAVSELETIKRLKKKSKK
jgi:hypothetical protein